MIKFMDLANRHRFKAIFTKDFGLMIKERAKDSIDGAIKMNMTAFGKTI